MNESAIVQALEAFEKLLNDGDQFARHRPILLRPRSQRLAANVLHRDERLTLPGACIVDVSDTRMFGLCSGPSLTEQSSLVDIAFVARASKDLEGHQSLEKHVMGEEHVCHSATPDLL